MSGSERLRFVGLLGVCVPTGSVPSLLLQRNKEETHARTLTKIVVHSSNIEPHIFPAFVFILNVT